MSTAWNESAFFLLAVYIIPIMFMVFLIPLGYFFFFREYRKVIFSLFFDFTAQRPISR